MSGSRFRDISDVQHDIREFIEALKENNDSLCKELWNRLRLYTFRRSRYHLHGSGPIQISTKEIDDTIHDAITDVYIGRRRWPVIDRKGQTVSFYSLICGVIQSKSYHQFAKRKNTISIEASESDNPQLLNEIYQIIGDSIYSVEEAAILNELFEMVIKATKRDQRLTILAELLMSGITSRRDLAMASGLSVEQVSALLRRLRAQLRRLKGKFGYGDE